MQNIFGLIDLPDVPYFTPKPREKGLTFCLDRGVGPALTEDVLKVAGDGIDNVRVPHLTMPAEMIRQKTKICREYNVESQTGGPWYELAVGQNKVVDYLKRVKELGFDTLEMSENVIALDVKRLKEHIGIAHDLGLTVYFEYGPKYPEEIEIQEAAHNINAALNAGARKVVIERAVVDLFIDDNPEGLIKLAELCGGQDNLIFEAGPRKPEYPSKLLKLFGTFVNLGNITFHPEDGSYSAIVLVSARLTLDRQAGLGFVAQSNRSDAKQYRTF